MKNILFAAIVLISLAGCDDQEWTCTTGDGPVVSQELFLDNFNSLDLHGSDKVIISKGETQKVIVEGQENIIHELNTEVTHDFWEIKFRDCVRNQKELTFNITVPDLKRLNISGSGEIIIEDFTDLGSIKMEIDGSGEISGALEATSVDLGIAGSGHIKLSGKASNAKLYILGSGELVAFDLIVNSYDINLSGSGDANVTALEEMVVDISGSGNVYYKGNPQIDANISGSGEIKNRN